ncbi:transposase, partial [bacterium]|nr:transposase [bacterium]
PTKEIYTSLSVLLFQQMNDLTDEEVCQQLAFDLRWHYALNLYEESDAAKYICPKTLWSMRNIRIRPVKCIFTSMAGFIILVLTHHVVG